MSIKIFVDALCDLSKKEREDLDIQVFPYLFEIEGKEYLTSEVDSEQIKNYLQMGIKVKTSRPALNVWNDLIQKTFEDGNDIFYVASTSKMTGALASINVAYNLFRAKFPERRMEAVDTLLTANAQACLITELVNSHIDTFEGLIEKTKQLSEKTFYSGSLHDTDTFIGNNRLEEKSINVPVIIMQNGLVSIDKEFKTKKESLDYIWNKFELHKVKRLNITYSCDIDYSVVESYLKDKKVSIPYTVNIMESCMYSYLGLDSISISWVDE